MVKVIVNTITDEKRFLIKKADSVEQVVIENSQDKSQLGNIYCGLVVDVVPGIDAAFVNIGDGQKGYLSKRELASSEDSQLSISELVHEGERILVQVTKDATMSKGPALTAKLEFSSEALVYIPQGDYVAVSRKLSDEKRDEWRELANNLIQDQEGLIIRTACENLSVADFEAELFSLRAEYEALLTRAKEERCPSLLVEEDTFIKLLVDELRHYEGAEIVLDDLHIKQEVEKLVNKQDFKFLVCSDQARTDYSREIDDHIDASLRRVVWLENGSYLIFDETEAMTVIDVNSGKFIGKSSMRKTILQVNELALRKIVEEVKVRNLSGIILIDFINMRNKADENYISKLATKLFTTDKIRTRVLGFTSLGILQVTRKKSRRSISDALMVPCPTCSNRGKVLSAQALAFQLERELWEYQYSLAEAVLVEASEKIITLISGPDNKHLERLEDVLHYKIYFRPRDFVTDQYQILKFARIAEIEADLES